MLSLNSLNKIILQSKEVAVIDEDLMVIDEISDEDIRQEEQETVELFPFKDRQQMIEEATRLSKFFKEKNIPAVYVSGIKDLRKFIDSTFEKMRSFYSDDLYLKDRIMDLQSIERKVKN